MRKRLIGGVTAICITVILVCNMFITASASVTAAALSVGVSLLLGALLNQMTGGQGYDFTDAFQDAVTVYPNLEENFENSDVYPIEKIEIDQSKVDIPDDYRFSTFGGTSADKTLIEIEKAINEGLESGSIEINVDEQGNVSMPTRSWCTAVSDLYYKFGIYTNKDGTNRVQTYYSVISDYIFTNYNSWDIISNAPALCEQELYGTVSSGRRVRFVPYFIANDELHIMRFSIASTTISTSFNSSGNTFSDVSTGHTSDSNSSENWNTYYETIQDFLSSFSTHINLSNDLTSVSYSVSGGTSWSGSDTSTHIIESGLLTSYSGKTISDFDSIQFRGLVVVAEKNYVSFQEASKSGSLEKDKTTISIPLTGVEQTIENMGLDGVGSGATAGTVSVNSTTKEIVVTNEVTQEAEKVIEQPKVSDIDLPDSDTIIDKFPFSLPFDIYRLLTIFVADEKEPIFEVPIQTSFGWSGIDVNVDESFTLDFTQFRINGIDIVQCLVRTSFNVLFIAFLIKITYKMIHK